MAKFSITKKDDINYLNGTINEDANLDKLLDNPDPVKISFKYVDAINSVGVGKWLRFMEKMFSKKIEFHECTPEIISTANMIPNFLRLDDKHKTIISFAIPYFCNSCDDSKHMFCNTFEILVENEERVPPAKKCPSCGNNLEDDTDDMYFGFYDDIKE